MSQPARQVAETMIELFADLPPEHEFFEQFSFISATDLPEFAAILERFGSGEAGGFRGRIARSSSPALQADPGAPPARCRGRGDAATPARGASGISS